LKKGDLYKYYIKSNQNDYQVDKGDPFAFHWETAPRTGSIVWDLKYQWSDQEWMKNRHKNNSLNGPMSIYEVHFGSWRRVPEDNNRSLSYREMAHQLADYVKYMGFTHVEFLPLTEHPFYGSWGYQTVGYFAPTSRYGTPQDFMYLVDHLHQNGIGVILDWVPSHFVSDVHGLVYFDGTHLYEHSDPKKGYHPDWDSYIFNYGRREVVNFLISSAIFWLDKYHVDGLRVDAVASMLYLDYSRKEGEWIPNEYGGRENLEAISFIKRFNEAVYTNFHDVQTFAEESTAWPMVSRPIYIGGLGFGMKWNMGWMHDTLYYFSQDPVFRKYHHDQLTFGIWYAFWENFMLSLSHDEVVHGKGSLLDKMPGDGWQKFANLRLLLGFMYTHPGKKLLFMGVEMGQWEEWDHDASLEWHLLQYDRHRGIQQWLRDLNTVYKTEPALYEIDFENSGFRWVDASDWSQSVVSFIRRGRTTKDTILVVCNCTPVPRYNYRIGVPSSGLWKEILNSDSEDYWGSGHGNFGGVEAEPTPFHGMRNSLSLTLPPLGIVVLKS
jgi:1,4-alpha-glucan branching enzyme